MPRQEVQVTVRLTFDADTSLDAESLKRAIADRFDQMIDAESVWPIPNAVHAVDFEIESLKEEAEIYGNV